MNRTKLGNISRYTGTAIALHWLMALMIVGSFAVGTYMVDLPFSVSRLKLYNWHKWAGVLILALSAARLLWRLTHQPPADLPMPDWQRRAAHGAHLALYAKVAEITWIPEEKIVEAARILANSKPCTMQWASPST